MKTICIHISGIVQGVGFRPFVYRLAHRLGVMGSVANAGQGVSIYATAHAQVLDSFIDHITANPPPLALIRSISTSDLPLETNASSFIIDVSRSLDVSGVDVCPDVAICDVCRRELFNPDDRRYGHPFINCTDCGPRYSIIKQLPYDRSATTMDTFELCPECKAEYHDPLSRRFHAQPVCCPACGPQVQLLDANGNAMAIADPLAKVKELLNDGAIVAVKGLGGFHLACRADRSDIVRRLRKSKLREEKPFALMVASLEQAELITQLTDDEKKMLCDPSCPIVIAQKADTADIAPEVAPGVSTYGIMLSYTPIHYLLFNAAPYHVLIMTSANRSDGPMAIDNQVCVQQLQDVADCFLVHDRDILTRVDDSIVRIMDKQPVLLRRARGFVPESLPAPLDVSGIFGCGGVQKSTVSIGAEDRCYTSQYIGTLDTLEIFDELCRIAEHMKHLLGIHPTCYAADLHPDSLSAVFAKRSGEHVEYIQHHHAHAAACMAENSITGQCVCLVFDGNGYGDDGTIWGGEVFIADYCSYQRVGHVTPMIMPGGDMAVRYPWRMALGALYPAMGERSTDFCTSIPVDEVQTIISLIKGDVSCPKTSSMGRLFDCVAAITGICNYRTYEGQPAIELEGVADCNEQGDYGVCVSYTSNIWLIDAVNILMHCLNDVKAGIGTAIISARFHNTITQSSVHIACKVAEQFGLTKVSLSGGCFMNKLLFERTVALLRKNNLQPVVHRLVSPNDESVSYGQVVVAAARRNAARVAFDIFS